MTDVAPLLTDQGYRVIVPFLRGQGSTQFLSRHEVQRAVPTAFARAVADADHRL